MSVFKTTPGINNLVNNNYLSIFKLLKRVLIDTSASKSAIKHSCMPNNIYNANKKISNIYWKINSSNFLMSHKVLQALGIFILFSKWRLVWDNISIPIKTFQ